MRTGFHPGLLLFGVGNNLMAQSLRFQHSPASVAHRFLLGERVAVHIQRHACGRFFCLFQQWHSRLPQVLVPAPRIQPAWYDRNGTRLGSVGPPRVYRQITLSPDESWAAMQVVDPGDARSDLWLLDLANGILSRLTSDASNKDTVVWSPDGREILFGSNPLAGVMNLYRKADRRGRGTTGLRIPGGDLSRDSGFGTDRSCS